MAFQNAKRTGVEFAKGDHPNALFVTSKGQFALQRQREVYCDELQQSREAAAINSAVSAVSQVTLSKSSEARRAPVRVKVPAAGHEAAFYDPLSPPINQVTFFLNGQLQTINNPDPQMTLNEYIRSVPGLNGTKKSCGEGGCGACTVTLTRTDATLNETVHEAINSCLRPVCALNSSMSVTTIEALGGQRQGFHPLQQAIADFDGSQCGFCTPGQVMNMYSFMQDNPQPTQQQIEDQFDGNLCRCTGYRPILDAFKSFAVDASPQSKRQCKGPCGKPSDIEDLCCSSKKNNHHARAAEPINNKLVTAANGVLWYNATSLADLQSIMSQNAGAQMKLVVGNTSAGIYKDQTYDLYINVAGIPDFVATGVESGGLFFGAAVTIADLIAVFNTNIAANPGYQTDNLVALVAHLKKVANVQVRNVASWAGNLMMTHDNDDFPSDLATILLGAGATVTVTSAAGSSNTVTIDTFLSTPMQGMYLAELHVPWGRQNEHLFTYKSMLRHQNAHAIVNAAFRILLDGSNRVAEQPTIAYGGILPRAFRLTAAETTLQNQLVTDRTAIGNVIATIAKNIVPDATPGKVAYRHSLSTSLFFKAVLALQPPGTIAPTLQSVVNPFVRPVSSGVQSYDVQPGDFPVGEPIHKIEAKLQASGEAVYTGDVPAPSGCLYAALVTATQANATLGTVDPTAALAAPGVRGFFSAKDLPADQNTPDPILVDEEVFVSTQVLYYGQVIGVVVADTQRHADAAAKLVSVTYTNVQTPLLTIQDAITANSFYEPDIPPLSQGDVTKGFAASTYIISGSVASDFQQHFHMETQTVLAIPEEGQSLRLIGSSQWPVGLQQTIAHVTGKSIAKVSCEVRRIGGGFGAKATRVLIPFSAVAFAADSLGLPVRMTMDISTNFATAGKRHPFLGNYKIGVDANGKALACQIDTFCNKGHGLDGGPPTEVLFLTIDNCYNFPNFLVTGKTCKTNLPPNTSCRGPGWTQAIFFMEHIMEHVATYMSKPPEVIRALNFYQRGQVTPSGQTLLYFNIPQLWAQIQSSADFATRTAAVAAYNTANRWTKRGIALCPMKFGIYWASDPMSCVVNVLPDGSVGVSIAGIEMGQGINTKVAQAIAYGLGIPLKFITVLPVYTLATPNGGGSGGSVTSELNVRAALNACDQLNALLAPVRASMPPNSAWTDVVATAVAQNINLQGLGYVNEGNGPNGPANYESYAVACVEVLLDVLTGENQVLRADILFDCGVSMNPAVDIGQIEGGFVQGLGMHLSEQILYDSVTNPGALLTTGTWEYKPPASQDIPIDFRVTLLKDAPNPVGILRSKAVGEPPLTLACCGLFALQHAIGAARADANTNGYFGLDSPATIDKVQQACLVDPSQFTF
eukprot:TRINITY_DN393_c0_g2_i1.p1 TRINITY_DN393_c0_g2~~TRINITY_DN393_c0_g2_i1.p1  ORF type:complete len:1372 (-),score=562.47 TRINITY_DN393_c0_g2_i1:226-4341(-)